EPDERGPGRLELAVDLLAEELHPGRGLVELVSVNVDLSFYGGKIWNGSVLLIVVFDRVGVALGIATWADVVWLLPKDPEWRQNSLWRASVLRFGNVFRIFARPAWPPLFG